MFPFYKYIQTLTVYKQSNNLFNLTKKWIHLKIINKKIRASFLYLKFISLILVYILAYIYLQSILPYTLYIVFTCGHIFAFSVETIINEELFWNTCLFKKLIADWSHYDMITLRFQLQIFAADVRLFSAIMFFCYCILLIIIIIYVLFCFFNCTE